MIYSRILNKKGGPGEIARELRNKYAIDEIVIHSHRDSCAATGEKLYAKETQFVPAPGISTGAGDNFNAAYSFASLMQLGHTERLQFANLYAHYYITNGRSPDLKTLYRYKPL
jgi:sugar/nucleoside kinase (ribokinase family)